MCALGINKFLSVYVWSSIRLVGDELEGKPLSLSEPWGGGLRGEEEWEESWETVERGVEMRGVPTCVGKVWWIGRCHVVFLLDTTTKTHSS